MSQKLADAERSGETGRAQRHALVERQAGGLLHHPGRRHADVLAKAARRVHPQVIAGDDDLVAWRQGWISAGDHLAGCVNARRVGILAGDAAMTGGGEGVFVVQRGVAHLDQRVVGGQVGDPARDDLARKAPVGLFAHHQRLEQARIFEKGMVLAHRTACR
jgi:hypothetical protein